MPLVVCTVRDFLRSLFHFFFTHPPPTEIYTLSLHDALPIWSLGRFQRGGPSRRMECRRRPHRPVGLHLGRRPAVHRPLSAQHLRLHHGDEPLGVPRRRLRQDRKSTRLNSSHLVISYAVFCLK